LQRLYLPVGLSAKPYPIPRFTVKIPLLASCSAWIGKPVSITWDPTKTTISSSRMVIRAKSDADPVAADFKFNNALTTSFFWGEGTKGTEQTDIVNVSIINGTNLFEGKACKHLYWIGVVGVEVDAYLEIVFEGETPERPWWEVFMEWFETNWQWIALGAGLVTIGGVTYLYVASPRS